MDSMKTELTRIVQDKQKTKKDLAELKNTFIAIIYGGLSKQEKVEKIRKRLVESAQKQKDLGKEVSIEMLYLASKSVPILKKQMSNTDFVKKQVEKKYQITEKKVKLGIILGIFAYELLKKKNIEKRLSAVITKEADKKEGNGKKKAINGIIERNYRKSRREVRKKGEKANLERIKIFYLASAHKDSATDHAPYQGKMYVDEKWDTMDLPPELYESISYYIKQHKVKTVQWVMGKPVWFITRPNCRHYFKEVDLKEVLSTSKTKLLNKYDMRTAIGDRQYLETIKHSTSKEWYDEKRNAQLLLKSYEERLSMHKKMLKENPCPTIENAIIKDKMLIEKWKNYLQ